jgi:hypothetical protein
MGLRELKMNLCVNASQASFNMLCYQMQRAQTDGD